MAELPRIGKYRTLKLIAQGGMGSIYLAQVAEGPGQGRLVILKCVSTEFENNLEYRTFFESEIRAMIGLSHPNIVPLLDMGDDEGRLYIILDWIEGKNVREILDQTASTVPLTPEIALGIVHDAAQGLHYAHTFQDRRTNQLRPIIHRDVSPTNLFFGYDGRVRIIDFGIAKNLSEEKTETKDGIVGKAQYMSPEACKGEKLDARTDVFSLGAVLWELLTGRALFTTKNEATTILRVVDKQFVIPPPSSIVPGISPQLDAIVLHALQRDRDQRFSSMAAFAQYIQKELRALNSGFGYENMAKFVVDRFSNDMQRHRYEVQTLCEKTGLITEKTQTTRPLRAAPSPFFSNIYEMQASDSSEVVLSVEPAQPVRRVIRVASADDFTPKQKTHYHSRIIAGFLLLASAHYLYKKDFDFEKLVSFGKLEKSQPRSIDPLQVKYVRASLRVPFESASLQVRIAGLVTHGSHQEMDLPLESPFALLVTHPRFKTVDKTFVLPSTTESPYLLALQLTPIREARLSITTDLSAQVEIQSEDLKWSMQSPIEDLIVPEGDYKITLRNPSMQLEKTETITLGGGQAVRLNETLAPPTGGDEMNRAPASQVQSAR